MKNKKIRRRSKRNPWRNTRNDFKMPWNNIISVIFTIALPIAVIMSSINIVLRNGAFYSFFLSRTGIVKEIPYSVDVPDIKDTFYKYMLHMKDRFSLKENSEYLPQQVFNEKDNIVMEQIRTVVDICLIVAFIFIIVALVCAILLFVREEKKLLYKRFKTSVVISMILIAINSVVFLISPIRSSLFVSAFGEKFPPGDVLIQIFEAGIHIHYIVWNIITAGIILLIVFYLMKKFVIKHKMFKI